MPLYRERLKYVENGGTVDVIIIEKRTIEGRKGVNDRNELLAELVCCTAVRVGR